MRRGHSVNHHKPECLPALTMVALYISEARETAHLKSPVPGPLDKAMTWTLLARLNWRLEEMSTCLESSRAQVGQIMEIFLVDLVALWII